MPPDELELLRQAKQERSERARDELVRVHTPLVKSIAARFASSGEPFEDLVQEGFLGLLSAIDMFQASHGIQFSTYAHHLITGQIRHYLRDRSTLIRQPAWVQELRTKIERCRASLSEKLGREPTPQEIAAGTGLPEQRVVELMAVGRTARVLRLDPANELTGANSLEIERIRPVAKPEMPVEDRMALREAISQLKVVEQRVIEDFFFRDMSQTEIARKLGVSCNYISRILKASVRKLHDYLAAAGDTVPNAKELDQKLQSRYSQFEDAAVVDADTGLYSRSYCVERLEEELIRAQRYGYSLAFLRISLAQQLQGGEARRTLREAASTIRRYVRRIDIMCRFGDREFALIMPHTARGVSSAAQRIVDALKASDQPSVSSLTVTTGVAVYPDDGITARELIGAATPHQQLTPEPG